MNPIVNGLAALRVASTVGPAPVRTPGHGGELVRALEVSVRVMTRANDVMAAALASGDLAGYERSRLGFDAAEQRYDELCAAASDAGYLGALVAVPDKPRRIDRVPRNQVARRAVRRAVARLLHPLRAAAAG